MSKLLVWPGHVHWHIKCHVAALCIHQILLFGGSRPSCCWPLMPLQSLLSADGSSPACLFTSYSICLSFKKKIPVSNFLFKSNVRTWTWQVDSWSAAHECVSEICTDTHRYGARMGSYTVNQAVQQTFKMQKVIYNFFFILEPHNKKNPTVLEVHRRGKAAPNYLRCRLFFCFLNISTA